MKYIYILLSNTGTGVARAIGLVTHDDYTHASISLDRSLNHLYSYARRKIHYPIISGFVRENIHTGIFGSHSECPCLLYRLPVSDREYRKISAAIRAMEINYSVYKYNIIGMFSSAFGIPVRRPHKFFCSQFVAAMLEKCAGVKLPKDVSLMKPADFRDIKALELIYSGKLCDSDKLTEITEARVS